MDHHALFRSAVAGLLLLTALPGTAPAQTGGSDAAKPTKDDTPERRLKAANKRVSDAVGVVNTMGAEPRMAELLAQARGVYIVPSYGRAALGVGAAGGSGLLLVKRNDGSWSNPAFYNMGGISLGLQAGAEGGALALVLLNQKAVDSFRNKNNFSLNADAGLTVVNYARMAQGSTKGDVVAWSGNKGLFGNAASVAVNDIRYNARLTDAYYGKATTAMQALDSSEANPPSDALRKALSSPPTPAGAGAK
jgi:lipid-binding SYLF domain-containing protein